MHFVVGIALPGNRLIGNGISGEIHHELAEGGPPQSSSLAETTPEVILLVLQNWSPIDRLEEEAWGLFGIRPELMRHTPAQLLNDCRGKILLLPADPMHDRNSDALGHNGVSCLLECFCRPTRPPWSCLAKFRTFTTFILDPSASVSRICRG